MAALLMDPSRAPVAFGRRAVPQLFGELQRPEAGSRRRALASLCDLMHDPERLYQTVNGGNRESTMRHGVRCKGIIPPFNAPQD